MLAWHLLVLASQTANRVRAPDAGSTKGRIARPTEADDSTAMQFSQAQATCLPPDSGFRGLNVNDRRMLAGWITESRSAGIETVEDLAIRPWPEPNAETVIGVFKTGHLLASWLIVGQEGCWAVACCADGAVSPRLPSLADALALVHAPVRTVQSAINSTAHRPGFPHDTQNARGAH